MMLEIDVKGNVGSFEYSYKCQSNKGITAIWGRSGAGKTTLLRVLAGLETPSSGELNFNDESWFSSADKEFTVPAQRFTGYVPQDSALFPHMSVEKNLTYALRSGKRKPKIALDKVYKLLGIEDLLLRYPAKLSGGEIKRVALGRAMLSNPKLLILDEPFNGLDEERIIEVSSYIELLNKEFEIPVVLVTHSARDVIRLANEVIVVKKGGVSHSGSPEDIFKQLGIVFNL